MNNKKSLLIVDDEEAILFAFKDILTEPGLQIDTAQSSNEVNAFLEQATYDAAIIDLRLGGSNDLEGFEIIRKVKEHNTSCQIVLLTAYATPGIKERALAEGARWFMEKPASPELIKKMFQSNGVL